MIVKFRIFQLFKYTDFQIGRNIKDTSLTVVKFNHAVDGWYEFLILLLQSFYLSGSILNIPTALACEFPVSHEFIACEFPSMLELILKCLLRDVTFKYFAIFNCQLPPLHHYILRVCVVL